MAACAQRKNSNVTDLNEKALSRVFGLVLTIALCVLFPAWTFDYWQAWLLISVLLVSLLGITLYLMKNDQRLLERRLHAGPSAETQKGQKIGQLFGAIAFVATFVVPALDHRFAWSFVPTPVVISGEILVIIGLLMFFSCSEKTRLRQRRLSLRLNSASCPAPIFHGTSSDVCWRSDHDFRHPAGARLVVGDCHNRSNDIGDGAESAR
jgi:hypothetical protein